MGTIGNIAIIIASIVGLWFGSVQLVDGAVRIARKLGMSELVIGLTIVAMGTSSPELAVSIGAALKGDADIAVANITGSNIFNLGFILGGVVVIRALRTNKKLVYRDVGVLLATSILMLFFFSDNKLALWESIFMMVCLFCYIGYLILKREAADEDDVPSGEYTWLDIPRFLIGLGIIVLCGDFLVNASVSIAQAFGITERVIGLTIVALGTSAPELAASLTAALKGRDNLSIGNLIGSSLLNTLGILALTGLIQGVRGTPIELQDARGYIDWIILVVLVIGVAIMMRTGWKLKKWEGCLLLTFSIGVWIWNIVGGSA